MGGSRIAFLIVLALAQPVELSYRFRPGQTLRIKLDYTLGGPDDKLGEMLESYDAVAEIKDHKDPQKGTLAIRFDQFERRSKVPGHSKTVTWSGAGLKQVEDGKLVREIPGENDARFDMFRRALLLMDFARKGSSILPGFDFELGRPPPDLTFFIGSLELALPVLPARAVKVGEKWEGESLVPPPSPNAVQPPMKLTYVLESLDAKTAVIRMSGSRETKDPAAKMNVTRAKDVVSGKARLSVSGEPAIDADFEMRTGFDEKDKPTVNTVLHVVVHVASGGPAAAKPPAAEGDGSSIDHAIVIHAASEMDGVGQEYAWLKQHYPGYKRVKTALRPDDPHKRVYDVIDIQTADGTPKSVYFDITDFYGKLK